MILKTLTLLAAFAGCAAVLSAQAIDPDTYKVNYFAHANVSAPDGTVRITNAGTSGGDVCADIYVFDPNQELSECCSCLITPDGLLTLSVDNDLTFNPLTGLFLGTGMIKIISAAPTGGACPAPTAPKPTAGVRAWATHIQAGDVTTETPFTDSGLSAAELTRLGRECSAIQLVGSGSGVCDCGIDGTR